MLTKRIPVPRIRGEWIHVYQPQGDWYAGLDTASYRQGVFYDEWIPNDFTMLFYDGAWHAMGITHPRPTDFTSDTQYNQATVHEAENQLFHCSYKGKLSDIYTGCFQDQDKILYPAQRPGELPACYAPGSIIRGEECLLVYGPKDMRCCSSRDLQHWESHGTLFSGADSLRDPFVWYEDGVYTMIYVEDGLLYRTSRDFIHWSKPGILQRWQSSLYGMQESPFVVKRGGYYYLFWCLYDGQNGCYDDRTFVYASRELLDFDGKSPIAMIRGHAPEIVSEEGRDYIVSVFSPYNGLSMAELAWE